MKRLRPHGNHAKSLVFLHFVNNQFTFISLSLSNKKKKKNYSFSNPSSSFKTCALKWFRVSKLFLSNICLSQIWFKMLLFQPRTTRSKRRKKRVRFWDHEDTVKVGLVLACEICICFELSWV